MPPSVLLTPSATPADLALPSPAPSQVLAGSPAQFPGAEALRYLVTFSVVPGSAERKRTVMAVAGSFTPGLAAAIFGAFHVVILPEKMSPATAGVRVSFSTPSTLWATAMGPVTMGMFQAGEPHA